MDHDARAALTNGPEPSLLLTVEETARLLKIGRGTAYGMAASGELPAVRIGRSLRVRRDKLMEWLGQHDVR